MSLDTKIMRNDPECQRWHPPAMQGGVKAARNPSAEKVDSIYQQAYAEGLEGGRREGYQQGLRQAQGHTQSLAAILKHIQEPLAAVDARTEQELLALALEIAKVVIRHELDLHPERLLPLVREAIASLPANTSNPRIVLHPQDVLMLRELMPELEAQGVHLLEDATIDRGGCRVLTDSGNAAIAERRWHPRQGGRSDSEVDVRVEHRWRQTVMALFGEALIS